MAGFVRQQFRIHQPLVWLDQVEALVTRELAPSPRKIRTALRISAIVTIAIGLDASCHVNSQLGAVIVWLLAGAGPMSVLRLASSKGTSANSGGETVVEKVTRPAR